MTNRKIDALVAEKVMGATLHSPDWPCGMMECYTASYENPTEFPQIYDEIGPVQTVCDDPLIVEPVPFYTTDPAASKQLRDRMRELGWYYALTGHPNGEFDCVFDLIADPDKGEWSGKHATEELAVSIAALACFDVTVAV